MADGDNRCGIRSPERDCSVHDPTGETDLLDHPAHGGFRVTQYQGTAASVEASTVARERADSRGVQEGDAGKVHDDVPVALGERISKQAARREVDLADRENDRPLSPLVRADS